MIGDLISFTHFNFRRNYYDKLSDAIEIRGDNTNLDEFINQHYINISSIQVDENPHMRIKDMDNWKVTLKYKSRQYTLYFSQGYGFKGEEPELKTVLNTFLSDSSYVNMSMEEFTDEFGYDYSEGKRIYTNIMKQDERLQKLFGSEVYRQFIEVEGD